MSTKIDESKNKYSYLFLGWQGHIQTKILIFSLASHTYITLNVA